MNNNVQNWLKMAEEDLLWAEFSLKDGMLRGTCFAAQQSAEKSLKAFLLSKGKNIQKIHDLVALNEECKNIENMFQCLETACNLLSPYYLSTRYPDVAQFEDYSEETVKNVVEQSKKVVIFVKSQIY